MSQKTFAKRQEELQAMTIPELRTLYKRTVPNPEKGLNHPALILAILEHEYKSAITPHQAATRLWELVRMSDQGLNDLYQSLTGKIPPNCDRNILAIWVFLAECGFDPNEA